MFCALLTSRYQVSVYRTNGPLVFRLSWVKHIILPVNKSHIAYILGLVEENNYTKVTVIEGCHTRHRSIYRGIQEVKKGTIRFLNFLTSKIFDVINRKFKQHGYSMHYDNTPM